MTGHYSGTYLRCVDDCLKARAAHFDTNPVEGQGGFVVYKNQTTRAQCHLPRVRPNPQEGSTCQEYANTSPSHASAVIGPSPRPEPHLPTTGATRRG